MLVGFFFASFFLQSALASGADSVEINLVPVAVFGLLGYTVTLYVLPSFNLMSSYESLSEPTAVRVPVRISP
jgi:hypothetical protein